MKIFHTARFIAARHQDPVSWVRGKLLSPSRGPLPDCASAELTAKHLQPGAGYSIVIVGPTEVQLHSDSRIVHTFGPAACDALRKQYVQKSERGRQDQEGIQAKDDRVRVKGDESGRGITPPDSLVR